VRPDVIVNAAAHTAVDKAESEPALALALNATAPGVLAREAAPWAPGCCTTAPTTCSTAAAICRATEDAPTGPLSVYGRTKLEGEQAIRASGCRHLILRTSWVYAARGGNFARTMLRLAAERDELKVIDDQVGAPTGADLLADVSALALRTLQARPDLAGTYHCVAAGADQLARLCPLRDRMGARPRPPSEGGARRGAPHAHQQPSPRPANGR
jgi:dTDP-4-dehydrorhamnose reductase